MKQKVAVIIVFSALILPAVFSARDVTEAASKMTVRALNQKIDQILLYEHVEDELIVKFRDNIPTDGSTLKRLSDTARARVAGRLKRRFSGMRGMELVKLAGRQTMKQALEAYLRDPDVEYAEPNYIVHATLLPDDPDFFRLWGMHNTGQTGGTTDADIDAPEAWDIATGSGDVVIAVVDSGVAYDHPDLADNIWTNTGETSCTDGIDNDLNGYVDDCIGWDFVDNDNDPMDYAMHGTHVSGTIAGHGSNGTGVAGVLWKAKIMPLRFLDAAGFGDTAGAIAAILYANAKGAHVINNSWGGGGFSQALKDAIDASTAVVVCAAGNDGLNDDTTPFYPASYTSSNIIAVAATDHNDGLAGFSNYGATSVDVAALGVSIYSTVPARDVIFSDDMSNLANWSAQSPWGLSSRAVSAPYSASDSPIGNYKNNLNISLSQINPLDLSGRAGAVLQYWLRLDTETYYDYLCIEASGDGVIWDALSCYYGSTGGAFYFMEEGLTAFDDTPSVRVRFRLQTDSSVRRDGAYIDDVAITVASTEYTGNEYEYFDGTSMATPHVSGVAGLVKAFYPWLTSTEIKNVILNSVDAMSSLSGKVLTGGRVNAFNALSVLACPNQPARVVSTGSEFSSIQQTYDAAAPGDTIRIQMRAFTEELTLDLGKDVTIEGGFDCGYTADAGITTIMGSMNVSAGSVTIGNVVLK